MNILFLKLWYTKIIKYNYLSSYENQRNFYHEIVQHHIKKEPNKNFKNEND